jgi:hypothetical protein
VYLAITGARVEIPAAVSVRTEGDETHLLDSRGVVVATFRSVDVLVYSMESIDPDSPTEPLTYSGK